MSSLSICKRVENYVQNLWNGRTVWSSYSSSDNESVKHAIRKIQAKIRDNCFGRFGSFNHSRKIEFWVVRAMSEQMEKKWWWIPFRKQVIRSIVHHGVVMKFHYRNTNTETDEDGIIRIGLGFNSAGITLKEEKIASGSDVNYYMKNWNSGERLHWITQLNISIPNALSLAEFVWTNHGKYSKVANNCQTIIQQWIEVMQQELHCSINEIEKVRTRLNGLSLVGTFRNSGQLGDDSVDLAQDLNANGLVRELRNRRGLHADALRPILERIMIYAIYAILCFVLYLVYWNFTMFMYLLSWLSGIVLNGICYGSSFVATIVILFLIWLIITRYCDTN
eukprot:334391_1